MSLQGKVITSELENIAAGRVTGASSNHSAAERGLDCTSEIRYKRITEFDVLDLNRLEENFRDQSKLLTQLREQSMQSPALMHSCM